MGSLLIGTRGSPLALVQAEYVAGLLRGLPDPPEVEIVVLRVSGGEEGTGPAHRAGAGADKSRWVDSIEAALQDGRIDLAVHSAKDVPGELGEGLELLGAPGRGPVEDALCGAERLAELPPGARVGTSSLRRRAQLLAERPDLDVRALHGNVGTRLRRLQEGELQGLVLARAGLERLDLGEQIGGVLDPERFVPAPGQGILALEGRADDERARAAAAGIGEEQALACLRCERALARALQADCDTALGAHAQAGADGSQSLRAWVGLPDGSRWAGDELEGEIAGAGPEELAGRVAERLLAVGAAEMLAASREMAGREPAGPDTAGPDPAGREPAGHGR